MSLGRCAAFYEAAGYDVVRTASGAWFDASRQIYQSLPQSRPIEPDADELRELLVDRRLLGAQFANLSRRGLACHLYSVRDPAYGAGSLARTFRQNVRRGETTCEVRELDFRELHRLAPPVNDDVRARRAFVDPHLVEPALWRRYCEAGSASEGVVAFGCFARGELAAWIVSVVEDRACYGLHMMSRADLASLRPNNLLYYEVTRRMLARDDVDRVDTGLEPIPPAGRMDRFKRQAGYTKEPCHLGIALHPFADALFTSRVASLALRAGRRLLPNEPRLARVGAVLDMARATRRIAVT